MFSNVVVGLKPGVDHPPLLELARTAARPSAALHLISLVKVGANEDEPQRLQRVKRHLEELAEPLRGEGYDVSCEARIVAAAAGHDLARMAEERDADLVVIGLAKRTRVGKALLGSDAQSVLMQCSCPVLSMRVAS